MYDALKVPNLAMDLCVMQAHATKPNAIYLHAVDTLLLGSQCALLARLNCVSKASVVKDQLRQNALHW